MGFFSFLSKKPEDYENSGDALLSKGAFGESKIAYEKSLAGITKLSKEPTADSDRVRGKLVETRECLAKQHSARAGELIEAGALDEARSCFMLALELTADPAFQASMEKKMAEMAAEALVDANGEDSSLDYAPLETVEPSDLDEFHALCGILPGEMEEAYISYGETFMNGYLALTRGEYPAAAQTLKLAMEEIGTQDSFIPLELANAFMGMDRFEDAKPLLKEFLTNHPASLSGIETLADLYCHTKQYASAHDLLAPLPDQVKKERQIKLVTGRLYFLEENYEAAADVYRELLSAPDWDEPAARSLVATLEAMEEYEAARNMAVTLLNQCSGCGRKPGPMDRLKYAELSVILKDYSQGIIDLYLAIAQEEPGVRSHCFQRVAFIFNESGRPEDAREAEALIE